MPWVMDSTLVRPEMMRMCAQQRDGGLCLAALAKDRCAKHPNMRDAVNTYVRDAAPRE